MFAYSGHGSQELQPTEFAFGDASGKLQNLLLFDAGHETGGEFVWPLADKELGLLLDEVAERRSACRRRARLLSFRETELATRS